MTYKKKPNSANLLPKEQIIVLFNKPFQVLCQFTDESDKKRSTLADYIEVKNVYAAGRLDLDSEGLLVLTNDGQLQAKISSPKFKMAKTYFVQVDNNVDSAAIKQLQNGVELKDGMTRPAKAEIVSEPEWLWERIPPVRERKNIPTSWIKLTITEGKNRQVRRMTAAVGFPTLRLIRYSVGDWSIDGLESGEYQILDKS